jgi:hypothetical protein
MGSPSPPKWGIVRRGRCQLRDIVPPTLVRLTRRALEGGPAAPSSPLLVTPQGQTVTSGRRSAIPVAVNPVRPSPPLLRHTAHCYNCSDAIEHAVTGRHHACYCTSYGSLSTAPSSPPKDAPVNHHASTLEVAPVRAQDTPRCRDWSKIRQDGRQLYGTVRHTATRVETVRHACNLLPPWPIKEGAAPQPQGTDTRRRTANAHTLSVFPTILALASITSFGTWRPRPLSRLTCSQPSTGTPVRSNAVPRAHPCWTYGPGQNQDKPSVLSCLAPTIERQISELITS